MGEYQYYQFQAIDKPLSQQAKKEIGQLSSRVELTPYSAEFVYHYSDLRAKPKDLLAHFDAMFYIANWGSTKILFRFPKDMVDIESWQAYLLGDRSIKIETIGDSVILELNSFDENDSYGWIDDGAYYMPPLAQLREDLLNGDLRILYLSWLRATQQEWIGEEETVDISEPPVPAGLKTITEAQKSFVEAFYIDEALLAAAAQASPAMQAVTPSNKQLQTAISHLSTDEITDFMVRLAQGEKGLSMLLRQALNPHLPAPSVDTASTRRTLDQLRGLSIGEANRLKQEEAACKEAERLKKLIGFAKRESQMWQEVDSFAQRGTGSGYQKATDLLVDLRELAKHQQTLSTFNQRVQKLASTHAKRPALMRRWKEQNLI
ncbi:hypothetical protein QUF58_04965 [Anaerolineales bacterium HSG24]|nr:hypothetical protein [Anaerolineales bacterium HSG24]